MDGNTSSSTQSSKYVITVCNLNVEGIPPPVQTEITSLLHRIHFTTSGNNKLGNHCEEIFVEASSDKSDVAELKKELWNISKTNKTDIFIQKDDYYRTHKKLVVFDMDSTLIQQEAIDELAKYAGVSEKVKEITHRAMNGELDFIESFKARVALLKGQNMKQLTDRLITELKFTNGAPLLCRVLKSKGYKLAVLSGGFTPIVEHAKKELNLDYAFANNLILSDDGSITGEVEVDKIVNAKRKAELLDWIAEKEGIKKEEIIAVGDGANDLEMMAHAAVGIAFNAKPRVQEAAEFRINQPSLHIIHYLLGISDSEAQKLAT